MSSSHLVLHYAIHELGQASPRRGGELGCPTVLWLPEDGGKLHRPSKGGCTTALGGPGKHRRTREDSTAGVVGGRAEGGTTATTGDGRLGSRQGGLGRRRRLEEKAGLNHGRVLDGDLARRRRER
jgi:hypothetical protein